ncbi:hypothetical protein [Micrococcus sp. IITD107]
MLLAMLLLSLVSAVLTWGMVTAGVSRPGASRVGILALSSLSIMLIVTAGALSSREDDWTGLLFLLLTPLHGALALWIALHARRAGPMAPSAGSVADVRSRKQGEALMR